MPSWEQGTAAWSPVEVNQALDAVHDFHEALRYMRQLVAGGPPYEAAVPAGPDLPLALPGRLKQTEWLTERDAQRHPQRQPSEGP